MKMYAITDKRTRFFLPDVKRGMKCSLEEFKETPRLFSTAGAARRSLNWWRKNRDEPKDNFYLVTFELTVVSEGDL